MSIFLYLIFVLTGFILLIGIGLFSYYINGYIYTSLIKKRLSELGYSVVSIDNMETTDNIDAPSFQSIWKYGSGPFFRLYKKVKYTDADKNVKEGVAIISKVFFIISSVKIEFKKVES
jgi:predicted nucleotide-binding protein (sugar kinase/HSP70/actin superfamily)